MAKGKKVVPESHQALDALKYEIAAEMGLPVGKSISNSNVEFATELGSIPAQSVKEDYWGHIASRDAGAVGGAISSRLIRKAEEILLNL
ncbi:MULTISPECIES: alpha/beta-type small acid-soluble spore protein [Paenibacillus]|uniref:Alpha/beta-type small acid-soluble spore protein n=1 Tax=Paenibacillus radicis (ex Xue et al. 2023) TaxID=2972489 RepID=A0ABT1YIU9_9BACL|nr:alpha/beta-type small acid-soluble spore protein [Paenibacillus radicis (ex Xue et al. 2023)]MCR8632354.1 alpha/beta-type small acid-soluble spore protein [Paenibacillus radicis (ex Xue et al. 2023)]